MPGNNARAKPLLGAGVRIPCRSWKHTEEGTKEGAGVLGRNQSHQGDRGRGASVYKAFYSSLSFPAQGWFGGGGIGESSGLL